MKKKIILVTGASSGIGAETARLLSHEYRIILCGRDWERLESVRSECEGDDNLIWPYDLSDINDIENSLSSFIKDNSLEIYGLAACAGMIKYLPVKNFSPKSFEEIFRTNVISSALLVKVLVNKKYNAGNLRSVVFVSSNISNFGAKAHALYSSSKAAVDGLMRSLSVELAPHVRVNSVLPGAVETRMTSHIYSDTELVERMAESFPMGLGRTEDIAKGIRFLISDDSRWITGQQLIIDGGRTVNLTV
ncbi:MAG: SDR family oxidoreductase [Muribaculaceae bacterium]|nr:SDR family oxidoreductase [Muribaculaceae bacterium]